MKFWNKFANLLAAIICAAATGFGIYNWHAAISPNNPYVEANPAVMPLIASIPFTIALGLLTIVLSIWSIAEITED